MNSTDLLKVKRKIYIIYDFKETHFELQIVQKVGQALAAAVPQNGFIWKLDYLGH